MAILTNSKSLQFFPSHLQARSISSKVPATAKAFFPATPFHSRAGAFSQSFPWPTILAMHPTNFPARISRSAALSSSGNSSGDALTGSADGGGGDGGSREREAERQLEGETEEEPALGSDVIILGVGGMTCGGCAASVKRILESQPQVASATVRLEKEVAVVWPVHEAKDAKDWPKELGEKLANYLTSCGFKSTFQGRDQEIGEAF